VAFDGSCNGLQNYSMMLRDEVGGAATNLIPAEKPADIYSLVAQRLEEIVARDSATTPEAKPWITRVTRKIAKQPTMTMPYGAGRFGYRGQIIDALRKIEQDTGKRHLPSGSDDFACAGYLAGVMTEALSGVVVKAAAAMEWLQSASRIASEDMLPIRWESPIGLPVVQDYREQIGQRIETEITGQRVT
jgi:DNA-directed RNA polymerase